MKTIHSDQAKQPERRVPVRPGESDWDWEYTGVVYTCPECGLKFDAFPPELDDCPACGADLWQDEQN